MVGAKRAAVGAVVTSLAWVLGSAGVAWGQEEAVPPVGVTRVPQMPLELPQAPIPGATATPPPDSDTPKNPFESFPALPTRPVPPAPLALPERPDGNTPPAGGLRQALAEYDRQLGLGRTSPIVSTFAAVGMSEWVTGEATFEVIVDRSGRFRSVRVLDASRDAEGWGRVVEKLRQSACRGIRFPTSAVGTWALVFVKMDNERFSGPNRYWWPGWTLAFDPSSAGSARTRVVRSHVLSEVWF
jgi:hypothetical protein